MKFAPGTPKSVMRDREEKFYGNKNKRNEATPPPKITAEMQKKAAAYDQEKQEMAARKALLYKQGTPKSVIDAAIAKENLAMAKSNKGDFVASNSIDDPSAKAEPAKGQGKPVSKPTLPVIPVKPTSRSLNPRPPVVQPVPSRPVAPPVDRPGVAVQAKAPPMPMGAGPTSPASLQPQPMPIGPKPMDTMKTPPAMKKGGKVKASSYKSGGNVSTASSASKRGDGIAQRGKTKGRML